MTKNANNACLPVPALSEPARLTRVILLVLGLFLVSTLILTLEAHTLSPKNNNHNPASTRGINFIENGKEFESVKDPKNNTLGIVADFGDAEWPAGYLGVYYLN